MGDFRAVRHIEGPYWSFSERCEFLHARGYSLSANAAEYLNRGDVEWAKRFAVKYAEVVQQLDRASARHNAVKDLDSKWIGWDR